MNGNDEDGTSESHDMETVTFQHLASVGRHGTTDSFVNQAPDEPRMPGGFATW